MGQIEEIIALLEACSPEERMQVLRHLRLNHQIHPFEKTLNTTAEVILEAISKASDLTIRGIRGVIAEAAFVVDVIGPLVSSGWTIAPSMEDASDCVLQDSNGKVRVQVKMQRLKDHKPMMANQGYRWLPADHYVTETQRTRGGTDSAGSDTRPYRFGEFDILAVSLHPSTNDWKNFVYTVADWLLPDPEDNRRILKFQPVSPTSNSDWTADLLECIGWFRTGQKKRIAAQTIIPQRTSSKATGNKASRKPKRL